MLPWRLQSSTTAIATTPVTFDNFKATLTANLSTLQGITTSLQASLDDAKKQYTSIATEKKTASDNAKKYTEQQQLLQQQLHDTQDKLKEALAAQAICDSKNNNVNDTLGSILTGKTPSITACSTNITAAIAGATQTASTTAETNDATTMKKAAEKAQNDLNALVATINTTRINNAAATAQSATTAGTPSSGTPPKSS